MRGRLKSFTEKNGDMHTSREAKKGFLFTVAENSFFDEN
jgi:hypothetical protein